MKVVVALYKFARLENFKDLKHPILDFCLKNNIKGSLLLAREGINGTLSGSREDIDQVMAFLNKDSRLKPLPFKESYVEDQDVPFYRMKVKLKKEIVTIGVEDIDPNDQVGEYVDPKKWNQIISDPEVLVIDTRNDYEVEVGTFKNAINPHTKTFREFPEYVEQNLDHGKHKKVAMFCTGGIRCEKASSYMLKKGFEKVYHLNGGILKYLEEVPSDESLWQGECFVFDNRVTVNHDLESGTYDQCHGCRRPITQEDKDSPHYQRGVCCPHCHDSLTPEQKSGFAERQKQMDLSKARGKPHLGATHKRDLKPSS